MKIFSWDDIYPVADSAADFFSPGTALTVGGFDGPHRGHNVLFDAVLSRTGLVPGVVTFARSPRAVRASAYPGDVSTLELRLRKFREKGFAFAVVIDFSGEFGKLSGRTFLNILRFSCNMRFLAVGNDFRCGYRLDTGVREIEEFARIHGIGLSVADSFLVDGERVSSSTIREAVASGDFARAERLLGSPFLLDVRALRWKFSGASGNPPFPDGAGAVGPGQKTPQPCLTAGKNVLTQILPPEGEYRVSVSGPKGAETDGVLDVGTDYLRLCTARNCDPSRIQVLEFA